MRPHHRTACQLKARSRWQTIRKAGEEQLRSGPKPRDARPYGQPLAVWRAKRTCRSPQTQAPQLRGVLQGLRQPLRAGLAQVAEPAAAGTCDHGRGNAMPKRRDEDHFLTTLQNDGSCGSAPPCHPLATHAQWRIHPRLYFVPNYTRSSSITSPHQCASHDDLCTACSAAACTRAPTITNHRPRVRAALSRVHRSGPPTLALTSNRAPRCRQTAPLRPPPTEHPPAPSRRARPRPCTAPTPTRPIPPERCQQIITRRFPLRPHRIHEGARAAVHGCTSTPCR